MNSIIKVFVAQQINQARSVLNEYFSKNPGHSQLNVVGKEPDYPKEVIAARAQIEVLTRIGNFLEDQPPVIHEGMNNAEKWRTAINLFIDEAGKTDLVWDTLPQTHKDAEAWVSKTVVPGHCLTVLLPIVYYWYNFERKQ